MQNCLSAGVTLCWQKRTRGEHRGKKGAGGGGKWQYAWAILNYWSALYSLNDCTRVSQYIGEGKKESSTPLIKLSIAFFSRNAIIFIRPVPLSPSLAANSLVITRAYCSRRKKKHTQKKKEDMDKEEREGERERERKNVAPRWKVCRKSKLIT